MIWLRSSQMLAPYVGSNNTQSDTPFIPATENERDPTNALFGMGLVPAKSRVTRKRILSRKSAPLHGINGFGYTERLNLSGKTR
jgi:hypothetical protein